MKNGLKAAHMFCSLLDYSSDIYVLFHCLSFHVIQEHSHIYLQTVISAFLHDYW